jgi:hypothetical protein
MEIPVTVIHRQKYLTRTEQAVIRMEIIPKPPTPSAVISRAKNRQTGLENTHRNCRIHVAPPSRVRGYVSKNQTFTNPYATSNSKTTIASLTHGFNFLGNPSPANFVFHLEPVMLCLPPFPFRQSLALFDPYTTIYHFILPSLSLRSYLQ